LSREGAAAPKCKRNAVQQMQPARYARHLLPLARLLSSVAAGLRPRAGNVVVASFVAAPAAVMPALTTSPEAATAAGSSAAASAAAAAGKQHSKADDNAAAYTAQKSMIALPRRILLARPLPLEVTIIDMMDKKWRWWYLVVAKCRCRRSAVGKSQSEGGTQRKTSVLNPGHMVTWSDCRRAL